MHNKLPQMWQLNVTFICHLTVLSIWWSLQCDWVFYLGYHKPKICVSIGLHTYLKALGENDLPSLFWCWQNLVLCNRFSFSFWLLAGDTFSNWRRHSNLFHMATFIFKLAMACQILLILEIYDFLFCYQLEKEFYF